MYKGWRNPGRFREDTLFGFGSLRPWCEFGPPASLTGSELRGPRCIVPARNGDILPVCRLRPNVARKDDFVRR
jgi:hypothetical protein